MRTMISILFAGLTAACSLTVPVKVTMKSGKVYTGEARASMAGNVVEVAGHGLTCSGPYSGVERTIVLRVTCSDGRIATVYSTRDPGLASGRGTIRFGDGEEGEFIFGPNVK